ncbi:alpha/beta hydrolase-fold protein [Clostridium sp. D53t1_180928_C8]|uniref:alpha/beta hydrolase n=1 Tax=Clostridium sp. D53t1_180928_C8 TaxID=2787101 RepID=UPI0018AC5EC5|nr:alpha/beta hydrolase-fold protein [Clostridium sp. D53t1_180928_C8]
MYRIENFEVEIKELNRKRMIRVYLPNDYDKNVNKYYKVMYMHDGHNLFYKETSAYGGIWDIQNSMSKSEESGNDGIIVVGIDCNNETTFGRLDEYSPWVNENLKKFIPSRSIEIAGGEGDLYVEFLVNSLKPYIDKKYRTLKTRENTFIVGSSMGGFISLYAGYKYPEVFSIIGAFSTAAWFSKENLIEFIKKNYKDNMKIYLDSGTKETSDSEVSEFNEIYVNDTKELENLLLNLGQDKKDIKVVIEEGANHSEDSWKRRFPGFLEWILEK